MLFSLATELPAAILARLLGIHITVAVQWQHAPGDDWTTYAAHYSRRANTSTASREQPQTAPHLRQPRRFEYLTPPVRVRASLDRHATYILARYLASAAR